MRTTGRFAWWLLSGLVGACGGPDASAPIVPDDETAGAVVTPPFAVAGEAEGLVLTWFDAEGAHPASSRAEVPEGRRVEVRVDSLALPPDARDPEHVFVADLRQAGSDGRYVVRQLPREVFDQHVDAFGAAQRQVVAAAEAAEAASAGVTVFGASWCGACRQTEAFLRSRGVPFVERDVEQEPGAAADMQARAARAGISPRGIPVIDFQGQIIQGFDQGALEQAIARMAPAAAPPQGIAPPGAPGAPPALPPGMPGVPAPARPVPPSGSPAPAGIHI